VILPAWREMMAGLIAAPSVSCVSPALDQSNLAVIELLAQWCRDLGMKTEILPIPGHPGKANLIATLGEGAGGLVLAGHTDTVPYDGARWRHDPFRLSQDGGRLYGLGTSDMKGFFALALEAARLAADKPLRQPLILLATADEESSMAGAQALAGCGKLRARHAVIGEPTGLRPVRLHKGILMEAIRVIGQSGHSSNPALGNSALEGMHRAIGAILAWRGELQQKHHNPAFPVAVPTLNLGHIHGGDNPNRICGECELHIDLRPLPGMEPAELREELAARVQAALADSGLRAEFRPLFSGVAALETQAGAEIVSQAEQLTGHPAGAAAFATEAPYLNALGMDTIVLGPGDIAQAHQPDEYLSLDRIPPTIELLQGLIRHFCL
jgi:acetylornithine deacetylase